MSEQVEYTYDLFISYAEADCAWVEGYLLPALGLPPERVITPDGFQVGAAVVDEFERAVTDSRYTVLVLSPAYLADEWSTFGEQLVSHASVTERRHRLIPLLRQPCILPLRIDFRVRLDCTDEAEWEGEITRLRDLLDQPEPKLERIPCPYPGMKPFSEADSDRFFGRDKEVQELLQRLRKHPFLAVIGPSGSGKSSLVFAGLVPALRQSGIFGPGGWLVRTVRPGDDPLSALATALESNLEGPTQAISELLAAHPHASRLLLVVDQFEELFTLAEDREVEPFQQALLRLAGAPNCYVVLTVGSDFYSQLMVSPMWERIRFHRAEVVPLDEQGLRYAIIRPAECVEVHVEAKLVERLLKHAAGGEPGILPLLQEALVLLWERLERRLLPLRAYEDLGRDGQTGLQVAMARHADAALAGLEQPGQEAMARRIFLRLIQPGVGRADTRRQQLVSDLQATGDDPRLFDQTVSHLAKHRLLTLSGEEMGKERKADIAHEALITGWPTLQRWLTTYRDAEQTRRRLEVKAAEWVRLGRGSGGLLDEVELVEVERWLEGSDAADLGFSAVLPELVQVSRAAIDEAEVEREIVLKKLEQANKRVEQAEKNLRQAEIEREAARRDLEQARRNVSSAGLGEAAARAMETARQHNEALREWTELANLLQDLVPTLSPFLAEVERAREAVRSGGSTEHFLSRRYFRVIERSLWRLGEFAEGAEYISRDELRLDNLYLIQQEIGELLREHDLDENTLLSLIEITSELLHTSQMHLIRAHRQIRDIADKVSRVLLDLALPIL